MGRATIISETGEGLYVVKVRHDDTIATEELAKVNAAIDQLQNDIDSVQDELDELETALDEATTAYEDSISAVAVNNSNMLVFKAAMEADPVYQERADAVTDAQAELRDALNEDPPSPLRIAAAESELDDAIASFEATASKVAYEEAKADYEDAVSTYKKAETTLDEAAAAVNAANDKLNRFNARLNDKEKRKEEMETAADLDFTISAWCVTLTTGLTGDVGTIEIAAEYKNGININPGGQLLGFSHDGIRTPFLTMGVADAMRNFAIMAGIQKYCPTFRYGTISNIDVTAGTCRVALEPAFSSIQDLDVNLYGSLSDVPIDYMTCDAAAFTDGDSVVVKFEGFSWDSPKVIGFKDHPKSCYPVLVLGCNGQYLAWDFVNQEVLSLGDLDQPTDYWSLYTALQAMGFTTRTRLASESVGDGTCNTWNPAAFSSYGEPDIDTGVWWPNTLESNETYPTSYAPNYYGTTSNTNENVGGGTIINTIHIDVYLLITGEGEDNLSDTGETFEASYHQENKTYSHVVREIYLGTLVSSEGTGYHGTELTERKAINGLTAARLSHSPGEKRRPCFYYFDGAWHYRESGVDREASFEKKLSYRSTINPDDSAEEVTTVVGACASYTCEYSTLNDYNGSGGFRVASSPVRAILKDELAFVLEQPVVYNEQNGEAWGFSKLYFTMDGAKPDPASDYEYEWDDLILMDMDAIYSAFGTTFEADMASRHQSAGISVDLFSSD